MRHEDGQFSLFEHVARCAAEDCFAEARMAIGAHDDQIGFDIAGVPHQHIRDPRHRFRQHVDLGADPVARKILREHPARIRTIGAMHRRIDHDDMRHFGRFQDRKRGTHGIERLGAFVPADHDALGRGPRRALVGDNENRSLAFEEGSLDDGLELGAFAFTIGLGQDREIGEPGTCGDVPAEIEEQRSASAGYRALCDRFGYEP